jgi:hypothetical protein
MNEQTSSRVSSIAARFINFQSDDFLAIANGKPDYTGPTIRAFCDDVRTLAASCLSQDETPGQAPTTFLDRLKIERAELYERTDKLGKFLGNGCPGVADDDEKALLLRQHSYMANYLSLLNARLNKHGIETQPVPELTIGETDAD